MQFGLQIQFHGFHFGVGTTFAYNPSAAQFNWIDVHGFHTATSLAYFYSHADLPTVTIIAFNPGVVDSISGLSSLPALTTLSCENSLLASLDISGTHLKNLLLDGNQLGVDDVNQILSDLVAGGVANGVVTLDNQTPPAPPSVGPPDGIAAMATLVADGWSVTVDGVPVNITLPAIAGTAQVGETLSGSDGTWTQAPTGYAYRWLANGVAIGGATANTFLLTAAQIGAIITFEVTATNGAGSGLPATSLGTGAVLPLPPAGVTNLTAVYASGTQINLAWTDNATNETEYRIYRSDNGGAYALYDTIAVGSVAYNDVAATASHVYAYKVAPANAGGETLSGAVTPTVASFITTTTGAQTLTISALTITAAMVVDWGDGNQDIYNGAGARTHNYAGAGTWTVRFLSPLLVTVFRIADNKVTLDSSTIKEIFNVSDFKVIGVKTTFNSVDVSAWRPTAFDLENFSSGSTGTFNTADISLWSPANFLIVNMPIAFSVVLNSADVCAWNPTIFRFQLFTANMSGVFNTSNVSAWNPTSFYLSNVPATYTITIAAGALAGWTGATTVNLSADTLSQSSVDQILADLYIAFATRTVAGGDIR